MERRFALLALVIASTAVATLAQKGPATEKPFLMAIEDVFYISGRGVVATGKIERGTVKTGDPVEIVGFDPTRSATVSAIEMFQKGVDEAKGGDNVGLLLRGVEKADIKRGQFLIKPGSLKTFSKIKAKIDVVAAADGGRRTPFMTGYRPQVIVLTASFSGVVTLPAGTTQASPGDKGIEVEIELTQPAALENGMKLALREYGRTVATGTVTGLIGPK